MDATSDSSWPLSGPLGLVLHVSRFAGIAPLQFSRLNSSWCTRVSPTAAIYGKVLISTLCILSVTALVTDMCIEPERSLFRSASSRGFRVFDTLILVLMMITATFTGSERMTQMVDHLNQINKINLELNAFDRQAPSYKWQWMLVIIKLIGIVGNIFYVVNFMHNLILIDGKILSNMIVFHTALASVQFVLELQLALVTLTILSTLKRLNDCFGSLLREMKSTVNTAKRTRGFQSQLLSFDIPIESVNSITDVMMITPQLKDGVKQIGHPFHELAYRIAYFHNSLCDIVCQMNKSYGLILVYLLSSCTVHLVSRLYFIVHLILLGASAGQYSKPWLSQTFWCVYHLSRLLILVEPCHRTQEAIDYNKELFIQMITIVEESTVILPEELNARRIILNRAVYTPLNIFTLNRALLVTIFSTVTTYLVIVIKY